VLKNTIKLIDLNMAVYLMQHASPFQSALTAAEDGHRRGKSANECGLKKTHNNEIISN
jgi:hypothetical protein